LVVASPIKNYLYPFIAKKTRTVYNYLQKVIAGVVIGSVESNTYSLTSFTQTIARTENADKTALDLPNDIFVVIASKLETRDICQFRLVNKKCQQISVLFLLHHPEARQAMLSGFLKHQADDRLMRLLESFKAKELFSAVNRGESYEQKPVLKNVVTDLVIKTDWIMQFHSVRCIQKIVAIRGIIFENREMSQDRFNSILSACYELRYLNLANCPHLIPMPEYRDEDALRNLEEINLTNSKISNLLFRQLMRGYSNLRNITIVDCKSLTKQGVFSPKLPPRLAWIEPSFIRDWVPESEEQVGGGVKEPNAYAYLHDAQFYFQQNNFTQMIEQCKKALSLAPDFAPAHFNLALAYFHLGNPTEALDAFRKTVELRPSWAAAHDHIAKLSRKPT
jgi:tetratricopeptide (TPR) repeat protein